MEVCPVGFFCFDRNTFMILIIGLVMIVVYYINNNNSQFQFEKNELENKKIKLKNELLKTTQKLKDNIISNNIEKEHNDAHYLVSKDYNRVINPLLPPERSNPYRLNRNGVPINIPTRGYSSGYQQVGALIGDGNDKNKQILPLFGMQTYPGSRQWQYYTSTDTYNSVKLPVMNKGKNCQDEYGCSEIFNGDDVRINGYNGDFTVNLYKLDKPRYLPYVI